MAKGDSVKVILDVGAGNTLSLMFEADKAGRSVSFERDDKKGIYEVEIVGRAGTAARTINLRADRVILIEEVPA